MAAEAAAIGKWRRQTVKLRRNRRQWRNGKWRESSVKMAAA
jgi:hypothetical protein